MYIQLYIYEYIYRKGRPPNSQSVGKNASNVSAILWMRRGGSGASFYILCRTAKPPSPPHIYIHHIHAIISAYILNTNSKCIGSCICVLHIYIRCSHWMETPRHFNVQENVSKLENLTTHACQRYAMLIVVVVACLLCIYHAGMCIFIYTYMYICCMLANVYIYYVRKMVLYICGERIRRASHWVRRK